MKRLDALERRAEAVSRRRRGEVPPEVIRAVADWTTRETTPPPKSEKVLTREEWEALTAQEQVSEFVRGTIVL